MSQAIVITPGEPAGIGPDITLKLACRTLENPIIAIADPELLSQRAKLLGLSIKLFTLNKPSQVQTHEAGNLPVIPVQMNAECTPQQGNKENSPYVIETIKQAVELCTNRESHALVTGPVNKSLIQEAGINFSGHTEYIGDLTASRPVMMLMNDKIKVALVTTHLPLADVCRAITPSNLKSVIQIVHRDLQLLFNVKKPKIAIAGLNPHAGENGKLGKEEQEVIEPTILELKASGIDANGPLPADTLFIEQQLSKFDVIVAMYHDQGLPVAKFADFANTVNVTLGIPIIRTSVDHGTAFELAGTNKASEQNLFAAYQLACTLKRNNF